MKEESVVAANVLNK